MVTKEKLAKSAKADENVNVATGARGKPGEKQPAHEPSTLQIDPKMNEQLKKIEADLNVPTKESSAARSQKDGNDNETPPHERSIANQLGTAADSLAVTAAGGIAAARANLEASATSEARLKSDPRYERDLKVLELAKQGKLGLVPPSESELLARSGDNVAAVEAIPHTPQEQVADDMRRLEAAETATTGAVPSQTQDNTAKTDASNTRDAKQSNIRDLDERQHVGGKKTASAKADTSKSEVK